MKKVMSAAIIAATLIAAAGSAGATVSENFHNCVKGDRMGNHFSPGGPPSVKTCQDFKNTGPAWNGP